MYFRMEKHQHQLRQGNPGFQQDLEAAANMAPPSKSHYMYVQDSSVSLSHNDTVLFLELFKKNVFLVNFMKNPKFM